MAEKLTTEVELLVPFHDVDMMEVVWHGHYCKYFEIARCALLESIDYDYRQMRDSGFFWPIIDLHLRFIKPARFGQRILVRATLSEWENRLKIDYLIRDQASGSRLCKGHSVQVAVDIETREMRFESPPVLFGKLGIDQP